jgi:hypothetical protein
MRTRTKMLNQVSVPAGKCGEAEIVIDTPTPADRLQGALHGMPLTKEHYTRLLIKGEPVMTDAEFEIRTNWDFDYNAKGNVLIAGLGIGLILGNVLKKESVKSVLVIEKSVDVVRLVYPTYDCEKLTVLWGDIFSFLPLPGEKYDTIYFDIWPNICGDYYKEIVDLKKRFRKYLAKGGWMHAWCEDRMKQGG